MKSGSVVITREATFCFSDQTRNEYSPDFEQHALPAGTLITLLRQGYDNLWFVLIPALDSNKVFLVHSNDLELVHFPDE